jgi:large subunit ribosomal protein L32
VNVIVDSQTGEYRLPHHVSLADGNYKGRQIIVKKAEPEDQE